MHLLQVLWQYADILDLKNTYTNNIHAMANTYGIEAAGKAIIKVFFYAQITMQRFRSSLGYLIHQMLNFSRKIFQVHLPQDSRYVPITGYVPSYTPHRIFLGIPATGYVQQL